jgi:phospholipase/carboxylesterase
MSGSSLQFVEYGPINSQAKKLVVVFHGYGSNAQIMKSLAKDISTALPDAKVIVPEGPEVLNLPKDNSSDALKIPEFLKNKNLKKNSLRQWFPIDGNWDAVRQKLLNLAPKINAFIDNQKDILGIDDKDIALFGFSQGGGVALYSAYTRQKDISCVVAHSTIFMPSNLLNAKPKTLFVYGDKDEEFSQEVYKGVIEGLKNYLGQVETSCIKGLSHKTNAQSRAQSAEFIRRKMAP